mmetsp:Transcript_14865/g.32093  ORF Transcript_14865/g.32093 Transcript_14865/m.32093 type:complete len:293 (-) Transcript_14865:170-1048(-)
MATPSAKNGKDAAWFSKIGTAVKETVQGKEPTPPAFELLGTVPFDPFHSRGFDAAELLEEGGSPGLALLHITPAPEGDKKEQQLVVERNPAKGSYWLQDASEKKMLYAKVSTDGLKFDIHVGGDESDSPSFVLLATNSSKRDWDLHSLRCEECQVRGRRRCGKRALFRLSHYVESVGEGQAFCMDVDLPCPAEDGRRQVLCDSCGETTDAWSLELTARRPKWNAKHRSLTLDFHGRCSLASAKNFQLEDANKPGRHLFLFGKIGENKFTLDYMHPLGAVQAFAIALTASHWK